MSKARVIAFYLPQFHPIPENDEWWGKGFTEWTNVGKAKPLFKGHYQPRVPADLGYYDLRVPETREAQAELARNAGIEGFCYWHYWFGNGKRLLERIFNEVLVSGKPDFPFCLAWANETWKGFKHGLTNRNILIEQKYPGVEDFEAHFFEVLPAFRDHRYITIDNKPIFVIYKPLATELIRDFIKVWRNLAEQNGLPGIHFVAHSNCINDNLDKIMDLGFDAINTMRFFDNYMYNKRTPFEKWRDSLLFRYSKRPVSYPYSKFQKYAINQEIDRLEHIYPSVVSGWDHTPRSGSHGLVLKDFTPSLFKKHIEETVNLVLRKNKEHRVIFLKSWNEWAEGNYVEPDLRYGTAFLSALSECL